MAEPGAPPIYSQQQESTSDHGTQILISPTNNAPGFQVGYLGADQEHSSIEGELQIKSPTGSIWDRVTITFSTVESIESQEIELATSEVLLFSSPSQSTSSQRLYSLPSSLPFSIPLTDDLPQAVVTPTSSISHTLTAKIYPRDAQALIKSVPVEIKRYTAASASSPDLSIDPVNTNIDSPVPLSVQTPRAVFRVGEPIPVYVTIPPPQRSLVESGLRLRNVKVELVREVRLGDINAVASRNDDGDPVPPAESSSAAYPPEKSSASYGETAHTSILARSGASCRFHSTRAVKLRLVLHESEEAASSGSITQTTLLHHVSFHLACHVSFTSSVAQSASSASVLIPILLLPPLAPKPIGDISDEIDIAYHKKHDPPPTRTTRADDLGEGSSGLPAFDEHPGGSLHSSHPPPTHSPSSHRQPLPPPPSFSEASAPAPLTPAPSFSEPPAFTFGDDPHQSTAGSTLPPSFEDIQHTQAGGSHLPSFAESESEVHSIRASVSQSSFEHWVLDPTTERQELRFSGEGEAFGFPPSEQYDGISHSLLQDDGHGQDMNGVETSRGHVMNEVELPPGIGAMVIDDRGASVPSALAHLIDAADGGVLGHPDNRDEDGISPPPPPAMDDPSDPPPAIDEGVNALSQAERDRRERAMVEAAAAVSRGAAASEAAPPPEHSIAPPLTPPASSVHLSGAESGARNSSSHILRPPGPADDGGPPPYLGVPHSLQVTVPGSHGPPPYVDL